jgi:hypothetical protein
MIGLLLMAVMLALFVYGVVYGLVHLATRRLSRENGRVVRGLAHVVLVLACIAYGSLVWQILRAHFDTRDFWSPTPESRLEFWSEACERHMPAGAVPEDVVRYLDELGVQNSESRRDTRVRQSYRYTHTEDWLQVEVVDPEIRNWSASGDLHVYVNVSFTDGRVRRCQARIVRHGR